VFDYAVHFHSQCNDTLLGNGVVGILAETVNMWERRAILTPSHCGRLLLGGGKGRTGVNRIIVQPSTKRIIMILSMRMLDVKF
jgi:alpha-aminoadipic semialdehyde synthase